MKRRLLPFAYWASTWLMRSMLKVFARWEIVGRDLVPPTGPIIMVSNHVHIMDPPLVAASAHRRVHPMAKRELFEVPLIGWWFWLWGAFPVRRFSGDMGALRVARNYLRNNEIVLMFPEGTRSRGAGMRPALPGAAMVAVLAKAPVVPVAITGSRITIPGIFWQWVYRGRPRIRVEFGQPFTFDGLRADSEGVEVATDAIMRRIAAMLPETYRGAYGAGSEGQIVVARVRDRNASEAEVDTPSAAAQAADAAESAPAEG
ncbi:MAG: 1-acyl-sn-glycerol-3-phosphate acyltransferase [Dehalococcoidia bacterium]|nr:1-acyl-sn-glycerol-3-phosphate acyltransferase [Dehalococcoidia bacterium]